MASEVTRVLREVHLNTEGGLVPTRASVPRRRSNVVKDDLAAAGATKARPAKKAAGTMVRAASWSDFADFADFAVTKADETFIFPSEIGVTKEAASTFPSEIGVTKADATVTVTSEIKEVGVTKDAGTFASEIGVVTKDATGTFASEICVTKEAAGTFAGEIGGEIGVTNKPLVGIVKPKDDRKAEPLVKERVPVVTKERVPESYIARIKVRPMRKTPDLTDDEDEAFADDPLVQALMQEGIDHMNYLVDMEQDCLRQHAEKGYAEVGVYFTSKGVKKMFILPD